MTDSLNAVNARLAQMVAGSVTFTNVNINARSVVIHCRQLTGGAVGHLSEQARIFESPAGKGNGSVTIISSSGTDTSWVSVIIFTPPDVFEQP